MIRKLIGFLFLFSSLTVHVGVAAEVQHQLPTPEIETLSNGLKVAWFVNDQLPSIDLALFVKGGFRNDLNHKSGTAELLSKVLDRGSLGQTGEQVIRSIERFGASHYILVEDDYFAVGIHGLAPDTSSLLEVLGKIVLHPSLLEREVSFQKERIIEKWKHVGEYNDLLSTLVLRRLLTSGTPYGRGSILSVEEFKKITSSDLAEFHKRVFVPSESVLMVVGRVDRAQLKDKIKSVFSEWKGDRASNPQVNYSDSRLSNVLKHKQPIFVLDNPRVNQPQVRMGFRIPMNGSIMNSPNYYPLLVANALIGELFNSRLNSIVRDELGLAFTVRSSFNFSKDYADFNIVALTNNEHTGSIVQKVIEVLTQVKANGFSKEEVETAKSYLIGGFPIANSTLQQVATRWAVGYLYDLNPDFLNEFVSSIQKVTQQDVQVALQNLFKLDSLITVISGNSNEIQKSISKSKLKTVKTISEADYFK